MARFESDILSSIEIVVEHPALEDKEVAETWARNRLEHVLNEMVSAGAIKGFNLLTPLTQKVEPTGEQTISDLHK